MNKRVFVTGAGIISAIGSGITETFDALCKGTSGIHPIKLLQTVHNNLPAGEVPFTNDELALMAGLSTSMGFTRTTLLAVAAAKQALSAAGITDISESRTGLISATTVGGMDKSEIHYYEYLKEKKGNCYIDTHDCGDHCEQLADLTGIHDFITTASTACSSSANSILLAARLIKHGQLDRVIAGGSECLTKFHLNGFNSLKILDAEPCKPFDAARAGINLGEGAAYLVLESEESALKSGRTILCELTGYGNSCEAFHQTASSPDGKGAALAMDKAIRCAGIDAKEIGYVNAHGTGTDNNDVSEGKALQHIFGAAIPPFSSTKPYTGHTTSAAGAIEAIISIIALQHGKAWPNLNFVTQIEELGFSPVAELISNLNIKHVLSNSFGFGGNNTSLIFTKHPA
ncbi:MAG: beta-ketoacyl-[acyl-carrier-protein] synthase family protein [Bacteroidota bacterium]